MSNAKKEPSKANFSNLESEYKDKVHSATDKSVYKKHHGSILSLLTKSDDRKSSLKTTDSDIFQTSFLDYKVKEIKKFDELNNSLSDISEFDLENYNEENDKSEFNSSEEDNDGEFVDEEIISKRRESYNIRKYDSEYENELERNFEEIIKILHINEKN